MFAHNMYVMLSQLSSVIPFLAGLLYYRNLTRVYKVLFFFMAFAMLMEFFVVWYARNIDSNNIPVLHIFTIIEYGSYCYIFCKVLFPSRWKQLFTGLFSVELLLVLLNAFVFGSLFEMNIVARTFEFVVLATLSLIFFRQSLTIERETAPIFKQPMFWISAGGLIYFSVNALFFLLFNQLINAGSDWLQTGTELHASANILANLLFAQAFLCFRKTI